MNSLTSEQQFDQWINSGNITVAIFKTTWCKDCHYLDVFWPEIERAYEGKVEFMEIDLDQFPELAKSHTVLGIPSFITFKNGKEITRFVNKLQKEKVEIEKYLNQTIRVAEML